MAGFMTVDSRAVTPFSTVAKTDSYPVEQQRLDSFEFNPRLNLYLPIVGPVEIDLRIAAKLAPPVTFLGVGRYRCPTCGEDLECVGEEGDHTDDDAWLPGHGPLTT